MYMKDDRINGWSLFMASRLDYKRYVMYVCICMYDMEGCHRIYMYGNNVPLQQSAILGRRAQCHG